MFYDELAGIYENSTTSLNSLVVKEAARMTEKELIEKAFAFLKECRLKNEANIDAKVIVECVMRQEFESNSA